MISKELLILWYTQLYGRTLLEKGVPSNKSARKNRSHVEVEQEYVLSVEMGLKILSREAGNFGLKMNINKTKEMLLNAVIETGLHISDQLIEKGRVIDPMGGNR